MSKYIIFQNKKGESLVYYPCAKNANSSAKLFFIKQLGKENEIFFIEDEIPRYKKDDYKKITIQMRDKTNLINILPNYQKFDKVDSNYKCCIIRNPIDRFLSSYKNRILFHKDTNFKDHTIDMILDKLENKLFENKHFLPQCFSLGNNLEYYSFYADIKNINYFEKKVNDFFSNNINFPKIQTGGSKIKVALSKIQILSIEKIYAEDFELYNSRKIKN